MTAAAGADAPVRDLTEREREVFALIAEGCGNDEIGRRLFVSEATVKTHVNRVIAKLGGRTRPQLVVLAYECGFVRPHGPRAAEK